MGLLQWTPDLETGIEAIDEQNRQLVMLINDLREARVDNDIDKVAELLDYIIDYTEFHFAFEEQLMKDAGYEFYLGHKRIHESFVRRVLEYYERFKKGEAIIEQLEDLFSRWLVGHIKREDMAYVETVVKYLIRQGHDEYLQKEKSFFTRLFSLGT